MRFYAGVVFLALVLISQGQGVVPLPRIVADWIPVDPGDTRIYQHETRDQTGAPQLEIHGWTTEETVIGSWSIPEGIIVSVHARLIGGALPSGYRPDWADRDIPYFIRDNCLYVDEVSWNPQTHQLSPEFRQELSAGHLSADFCFPLTTGKTWGASNFMNFGFPSEDWKVEGIVSGDKFSPNKGTTFHIVSNSAYLGSGMTGDIWFQKGIGVVRQEFIHHGTIGENRDRLVRFVPSKPKR